MTKREQTQFNKSYHTYKRDWYLWKNKGWAMKTAKPWTEEEYKKKYALAKDAGLKNIGANFASSSRILDSKSAKELQQILGKVPSGADSAWDHDVETKFSSLSKIKRNIGDYNTYVDGIKYTGKQAIYLDIKFLFGIEKANEYYGY